MMFIESENKTIFYDAIDVGGKLNLQFYRLGKLFAESLVQFRGN